MKHKIDIFFGKRYQQVPVCRVTEWNGKIETENGIQVSTYININRMKQSIQIHEENTENPIMIFIQGDPASPMSWPTDSLYTNIYFI